MMTDTQTSGERTIETTGEMVSKPNCSRNREQQRGLPIDMRRMMGLDVATKLLGKGALAEELGVSIRALNYKLNAERGISNDEVLDTACLLEQQADRLVNHARKLRGAVSETPAAGMTARPPTSASAARLLGVPLALESTNVTEPGGGRSPLPHALAEQVQ